MTVEFYDALNGDGLFDLHGKVFYAQKITDTHIGTTIPAEIVDVVTQFRKRSVEMELQQTIIGVTSANDGVLGAGATLKAQLGRYSQQILIELIHDDNSKIQKSLGAALSELVDQMTETTNSVDASAVTVAVSAAGGNSGNGVLVLSAKSGDGRVVEYAYGETIEALCISGGTTTSSFSLTGDLSVPLMDVLWPKGSNCATAISTTDAASSLLANGDFEDEDDLANAPDDWDIPTGTVGTDILMTNVEVQRIVISGTPTGGTYKVQWVNVAGDTEQSVVLDYNASSADLQTALRPFQNLNNVSVATTGTSPNYTHDITFGGAGGNLNQFTSISSMTGGSPVVTHSTPTSGDAEVYVGGKSLKMVGDASTSTTIQQKLVSLRPKAAYAVSGWVNRSSGAITSGVITVDLVEGFGGSVINDAEGTANSFTFNASSLTTTFKSLNELVTGETVFRIPAVVPTLVYLRIRQSTPIDASAAVFFDHWAVSTMTQLYPGGPLAAAFSGSSNFEVDDKITITVTNDRAGEVQEWYNRNFNMARLGLLLPSNAAGSETIPDTVVS